MPCTFDSMPMEVNSQQVGTAQSCKITIKSNGEDVIGPNGEWIGATDGALTAEGTLEKMEPTDDPDGLDVDLISLVLGRDYVTLGAIVGTRMVMIDCKIREVALSGDNKAGKTQGTYTFSGGNVRVLG
jgi:hypothetical protein